MILENYYSSLNCRFLELVSLKSVDQKIQSLVDFFTVIEILPENAFSLKNNASLKTKIYEILNKKGIQVGQYNDIKNFLVALDSFDYFTYGSIQDLLLDILEALKTENLKSIPTLERIARVDEISSLAAYVKSLNERLLRHIHIMIKLDKQGVVTNKSIQGFIVNKIKIEVSLLRILIPFEAALYKLAKGFGIIAKTQMNTFYPNRSECYKIIGRYFIPYFQKLEEVKRVLSDQNELFNIKQTLSGSIQTDFKKCLAKMEDVIPIQRSVLQNTLRFSFELYSFFQKNEVS